MLQKSGARYIVSTLNATWCIRNSMQFKLGVFCVIISRTTSFSFRLLSPVSRFFSACCLFHICSNAPKKNLYDSFLLDRKVSPSASWLNFIKTSNCINFSPSPREKSLQCYRVEFIINWINHKCLIAVETCAHRLPFMADLCSSTRLCWMMERYCNIENPRFPFNYPSASWTMRLVWSTYACISHRRCIFKMQLLIIRVDDNLNSQFPDIPWKIYFHHMTWLNIRWMETRFSRDAHWTVVRSRAMWHRLRLPLKI